MKENIFSKLLSRDENIMKYDKNNQKLKKLVLQVIKKEKNKNRRIY